MTRDQRSFPLRFGGRLRRLASDRRGGTAIEYGLILALVVIAMISALVGVAGQTTAMWNNVSSAVSNAH